METTKQTELDEKYNNSKIEEIKAEMEKKRLEEEARIKDGIKWGDKDHPIVNGDYLVGTVTNIEAGKDKETSTLTFITFEGKCTVDGLAKTGTITTIANKILKDAIEKGVLRVGKEVSIQFLGLKQGAKKTNKPYKLYQVMPL